MLDPVAVERVEAELDSFIEKRARERKDADTVEDLWRSSERAYRERRRRADRDAWADYHRDQAERLRRSMTALIEKHEEAAAKLLDHEERNEA